jgi:hypothetical protein
MSDRAKRHYTEWQFSFYSFDSSSTLKGKMRNPALVSNLEEQQGLLIWHISGGLRGVGRSSAFFPKFPSTDNPARKDSRVEENTDKCSSRPKDPENEPRGAYGVHGGHFCLPNHSQRRILLSSYHALLLLREMPGMWSL